MNKRILLLEDNPISREFLHEALLPLPITVDIAETLANAIVLAELHRHCLFLCDVHLPDGGPGDIFQSLRKQQCSTIIVAITADAGAAASQLLLDIGYQEVWSKPITMTALQTNTARVLGLGKLPEPGLWDEAAALRAVGQNMATLATLRKMFIAELPLQSKNITDAFQASDTSSLKAECHRLLAGCGFVGAIGLNIAVKHLSEKPEDRQRFDYLIQQVKQYLSSH